MLRDGIWIGWYIITVPVLYLNIIGEDKLDFKVFFKLQSAAFIFKTLLKYFLLKYHCVILPRVVINSNVTPPLVRLWQPNYIRDNQSSWMLFQRHYWVLNSSFEMFVIVFFHAHRLLNTSQIPAPVRHDPVPRVDYPISGKVVNCKRHCAVILSHYPVWTTCLADCVLFLGAGFKCHFWMLSHKTIEFKLFPNNIVPYVVLVQVT